MVLDIFTYNGEQDLLEIRLNILSPFVDKFIIVEAKTTFSGQAKPLYFEKQMSRFEPFLDKIKYHVIDENYSDEEIAVAENSPFTRGAKHWKNEFLQKESIKKAIKAKDTDLVFIGDVDEIWFPKMASARPQEPVKLKLMVYTYFLNNRSSEEFWGTVVALWRDIKDECLNEIRNTAMRTDDYAGWHFTSMGGYKEVKRKLQDSYTRESYWTHDVEDNLRNNIKNRKDFLGRDFKYDIDEKNWPLYLHYNKNKYKELCI